MNEVNELKMFTNRQKPPIFWEWNLKYSIDRAEATSSWMTSILLPINNTKEDDWLGTKLPTKARSRKRCLNSREKGRCKFQHIQIRILAPKDSRHYKILCVVHCASTKLKMTCLSKSKIRNWLAGSFSKFWFISFPFLSAFLQFKNNEWVLLQWKFVAIWTPEIQPTVRPVSLTNKRWIIFELLWKQFFFK